MRIVAPPPNEFKLPDEGVHKATFTAWEDLGIREDVFNKGKTKHEVKLTFALEGGATQLAWVRASLHEKATLYKIAKALLGTDPGKAVELPDLVGNHCEVEIEHCMNTKGDVRSKIVRYRGLGADKRGGKKVGKKAAK